MMIRDGEQFLARSMGQDWLASWHPPPVPPPGTAHGSAGICVTAEGDVVLIEGPDGSWELPAGRPEGRETWEETLRREIMEEACARVVSARLLGFSRGVCVEGREEGLVLVRAIWRAEVELGPWEPQFEVAHRRVVPASAAAASLALDEAPFGPILHRALSEAGIA